MVIDVGLQYMLVKFRDLPHKHRFAAGVLDFPSRCTAMHLEWKSDKHRLATIDFRLAMDCSIRVSRPKNAFIR